MYSSDMFSGMLIGLVAIGALIGAAFFALLFWLIPLAWEWVRPWLHGVTA